MQIIKWILIIVLLFVALGLAGTEEYNLEKAQETNMEQQ